MITADEKARIIKEYAGTEDGDTGSPEVQVSGRNFVFTHCHFDRALQDTQKRQPWPPWSFENGCFVS